MCILNIFLPAVRKKTYLRSKIAPSISKLTSAWKKCFQLKCLLLNTAGWHDYSSSKPNVKKQQFHEGLNKILTWGGYAAQNPTLVSLNPQPIQLRIYTYIEQFCTTSSLWPHVKHTRMYHVRKTHTHSGTSPSTAQQQYINVGNVLPLSPSQALPKQACGSRHSSAHTAMCLHSGTLCLSRENIMAQAQKTYIINKCI